MHFSTLLSTTALALAATSNAFLVPQEIAEDVKAAKAKVSDQLESVFHRNTKSLDLECISCPFLLSKEENGASIWSKDVENNLQLEFAAKDKHLTLNGNSFYPATLKDLPGVLYAYQAKKEDKNFKVLNKLKLSYTLEFEGQKADDGSELAIVTMSILGIDKQMVRVDNVQIKAIKEADGSLHLVDITAVPASNVDAKCTNMMCRVMTKLGAAISKARAKAASAAAATSSAVKKVKCFCVRCFHRMAGHPVAVKEDSQTTHVPTHNVVRPFRVHHGHHRGFLHSTLRFARHIFTLVLLPVMVGVAVGITASAIGMLVGQAVVFLWMKYRRNRNRQQGTYEAVESEDKEDNLPAYDAQGLPAYVDIEDEKHEVENKA